MVREGLGVLPGIPGRIRRPTRRSLKSQESHPVVHKGRETHPKVRELSGGQPEGP